MEVDNKWLKQLSTLETFAAARCDLTTVSVRGHASPHHHHYHDSAMLKNIKETTMHYIRLRGHRNSLLAGCLRSLLSASHRLRGVRVADVVDFDSACFGHCRRASLTHVSLSGHSLVRPGDAALLARRCGLLRCVHLDASVATNAALLAVAAHCPDLRELRVTTAASRPRKLAPASEVPLAGLLAVARQCVKLRAFSFVHACHTDRQAALLLEAFTAHNRRRLREFALSARWDAAAADAFAAFVRRFPAVRSLELRSLGWMPDQQMRTIADGCTGLVRLRLVECKAAESARRDHVSGFVTRLVKGNERLRKLHLHLWGRTMSPVVCHEIVEHMGKLKYLQLAMKKHISPVCYQ